MYKAIIRPFLFLFSAERAHHFSFTAIKVLMAIPGMRLLVRAMFSTDAPSLQTEAFGLQFANPVGLAAGFDKDARLVDELEAFGFGFVEIGTLTPRPQPGNPKPRLFRLKADAAIINRMGFNNEGVAAAVARLKRRKGQVIVGGNIGKNKDTPNEQAVHDYEQAYLALYEVVDYFVVNVSSPNTPNLRALQDKGPLTELLTRVKALNSAQPRPKPVLLKIAPDLSNEQLDEIVEIVLQTGIDGIIATNTTIARAGLTAPEATVQAIGAGGLSGQALKQRATEVIAYLHKALQGKVPIIGVGGIASADDALEKIKAGATLVQVYTGFVYEGPALVRAINKALVNSSTTA